MARFVKVANHMGADEARGTGDENGKRAHAKLALSIRLDSHISSRFRNSDVLNLGCHRLNPSTTQAT
jgi:hypothetical protein